MPRAVASKDLVAATDTRAHPSFAARLLAWLARAWALTRENGVLILTLLIFLVPALVDLLSDARRPYGYVAPDAFYYFTIGVNWAHFGIPTYDQLHATNGFHPLWQWAILALYEVISRLGLSRFALVPASVIVCLLCTAVTLILFGRLMARGQRLSPGFMLLPVGAFSAIISPWWWSTHQRHIPLFGTLWCFSNGMESAVTLLAYACAAWLYVRRPMATTGHALLFGSVLGALSLARLDHAVFAAVILCGLVLEARAQNIPGAVKLSLCSAFACGAWLGAYLVYNRLTVGRFMPMSGAVKSTFPAITTGNLAMIGSFPSLSRRVQLFELGRLGSLVLPAFGALAYLLVALEITTEHGRYRFALRPRPSDRLGRLFLMTAIGTILLATYDVLFVTNYHIGQWYAPVPVLFLSLLAVRVGDWIAASWRPHYARATSVGVLLAIGSSSLVYFWYLQRVLSWGDLYADFCLVQAPRAVAHYAPSPPSVLSYDDGVVAFATGFPTTAGTLLAIDPAAEDAWRAGKFKDLVEKRGVNRIAVLSQLYGAMAAENVGKESEALRPYAATVLHDPLETRNVEVEYSDGAFALLRTHPREP